MTLPGATNVSSETLGTLNRHSQPGKTPLTHSSVSYILSPLQITILSCSQSARPENLEQATLPAEFKLPHRVPTRTSLSSTEHQPANSLLQWGTL
jgi:hypothetical protein